MGILRGGEPGRVVMMRGDMDALPITEKNALSFAYAREKTMVGGRNAASCTPTA